MEGGAICIVTQTVNNRRYFIVRALPYRNNSSEISHLVPGAGTIKILQCTFSLHKIFKHSDWLKILGSQSKSLKIA